MFNLLLWVIFGGVAGWIASIIVGTEEGTGIITNVIIGVVGAFIGGWITDKLGVGGTEGAERPTGISSFIWAVIGAIVLLLIINLIF